LRGGRTTKIHALTDAFCRPIAFLLTGGQVADCTAADTLLDAMPKTGILHGDKGYDSNAVRAKIESKGTAPNIPPKVNRRWRNCFSPVLYRERNAIERMFCRLLVFAGMFGTAPWLSMICRTRSVSYPLLEVFLLRSVLWADQPNRLNSSRGMIRVAFIQNVPLIDWARDLRCYQQMFSSLDPS
jgi:transposase